MLRCAILATLTIVVIAILAVTASAQIPLNMSYQARLADNQGNPVPDSTYNMEFRFYADSTSGTPVWTESFFDVFTENGFFDVRMGPPDLDAIGGSLFMETIINGEYLYPRQRMTSAPFSAVAQRMQGDIKTGEGFIRMSVPPDDIHPVAEIMSDDITNITTFKLGIPPDPITPAIEMTADASANTTKFKLGMPPDDQIPWVEMESDGASQISKIKLGMPPDDIMPAIEMKTDMPADQTTFKLGSPPDDQIPAIEMMRDANANITNFKLQIPPDDQTPA
jgi:hypothetical protein